MALSGRKIAFLVGVIGLSMNAFSHVEEGANSELSLKAVMQGLSADTQKVTQGILAEDYQQIEKAAYHIAYHPGFVTSSKKKIIDHLGKEMKVFKSFDKNVHDLAMQINQAAKEKNMPKVVTRYHQLIDGCLACHSQFKQQVIEVLKQKSP